MAGLRSILVLLPTATLGAHDNNITDFCDAHVLRRRCTQEGADCLPLELCRPSVQSRVGLRRVIAKDGSPDFELWSRGGRVVLAKLSRSFSQEQIEWRNTPPEHKGPGSWKVTEHFFSSYEAVQVFADKQGGGVDVDLQFRVKRNFAAFPPARRTPPGSASRVGASVSEELPDIYMLLLDSTSRRALRRFAPRIQKLFHRRHPHHVVFTFPSFHTIAAGGTRAAIYPLLHGGFGTRSTPRWCSKGVLEDLPWKRSYSAESRCFNPSRRILRLARAAGFVVGLSSSFLLPLFNSLADPHHMTCPAICGELGSNRDRAAEITMCLDSLCYGAERYGQKIMSFNEEIFRVYQDHPKLVVSMLHGAHQGPEHLSKLEPDLLQHLERVLAPSSDFRDSIVVVMGDHGHKSASCDYPAPFLGVFAPRAWAASVRGRTALAALRRNSLLSARGMLITAWDLYATLRHLISWVDRSKRGDHFGMREIAGFGDIQSQTEPRNKSLLYDLVNDLNQRRGHIAFGRFRVGGPFSPLSLLATMPRNRSCEEAGIAADHCLGESVQDTALECDAFVGTELTDDVGMLAAFQLADQDRDGELTFGEGAQLVSTSHPELALSIDLDLLLALLDIDGDNLLQPNEVRVLFPVQIDRIVKQSRTAAFWCAAAWARAAWVVKAMNAAYTSKSAGHCRNFTLSHVGAVLGYRSIASGLVSRGLRLFFTVGEGDPPSRYEAAIAGGMDEVSSSCIWKLVTLSAVTRYHKYQQCTPPGSPAEFCVCV